MTISLSTDLDQLVRQYASRPDDWPFAPRFDPLNRWYHRLATTDDAEVWLLTWLPGQGTGLHDHGGSAGAFTVVSGTLTERVATISGNRIRLTQNEYAIDTGHRFDARHIHDITNLSDRPAVSVHAYAPALGQITRYRLQSGRLRVTQVDRAGVSW